MKNEWITIGPITIHGYGVMIAIGVILAYVVGEYRAKKRQMNHEVIIDIAIWSVLGGFLGAKVLYLITQWKEIMESPELILTTLASGFVVYGGIIGGILSGYFYIKSKKMNFLSYFDLIMPSVALAQGFGRIGCFFAGCCYGSVTESAIGMVYYTSEYAPTGVSLVPTQLISSGLNFVHFFILIWFAKRNKVDGRVAGLYLVLYSIGRFILEFFRGDLERGSVGSLSTSQFISLFLVLVGFVFLFRKSKETENEG